MSHCSHCYNTFSHNGFNVGHWWNNEPYMAKVCSVECKDKLWKMMQDGTWMTDRKFPSSETTTAAGKKEVSGLKAYTDTQFESMD